MVPLLMMLYSSWGCFFFKKQLSSCLRVLKYTFRGPELKFGKYSIYFGTLLCSWLVPSPFFGAVLLFCLGNQMAVFEASLSDLLFPKYLSMLRTVRKISSSYTWHLSAYCSPCFSSVYVWIFQTVRFLPCC